MNEPRTTAGLVGDALAGMPGQRLMTKELQQRVGRDRTGIVDAVLQLKKAGALTAEPDPEDRRRNVVYMTPEQAAAWLADGGASYAIAAGRNLTVSPIAANAARASAEAAQRRREDLSFGVWNDGRISIEGLTRKQLMLPAADTGALAHLFSQFPEGALQALCESPLKPTFTLNVDGKAHPLNPRQTASLVAYIEGLPASLIRTLPVPGVKAPGTDHRVHRMETPADRED